MINRDCFIIVNIRFEHSTYTIKEDSVALNTMIILSQPSPVNLTLPINFIDGTTTGDLSTVAIHMHGLNKPQLKPS